MKKLLSPRLAQGALAIALLSLSVPVQAQIQLTSPDASTTPTITTVTTTTPVAAYPGQPLVLSTQEIILGPYIAGTGMAPLPRLAIAPNTVVELHLLNPSPSPLTFSSPNLNLSYVVPANSQRTVYIDPTMTANLTPGQQVAYYVTDAAGNCLATSLIVNVPAIASLIDTQVVGIIEIKEEKEAVTPIRQERRGAVRGYW